MKKLNINASYFLYALLATVLLCGCAREKVQPIEKYSNNKYVIAKIEKTDWGTLANLRLKNQDTIFWITVLKIDYENVTVGDTIR